MSAEVEAKLSKIPVVKTLVKLLKKMKLKALEGLSVYDVLEMYTLGIINGALSYRAAAISYSFFIAIFPFLLFLLNLIPYVPIDDFQSNFLHFIESLMPPKTASWFQPVIEDIANRKRGGMLSSVFALSIILMANGINAIFGGFENSYHQKIKRNYFRQYLVSVGVAIMLGFLFLIFAVAYLYFEVDFVTFFMQNFVNHNYVSSTDAEFSLVKILLFVGLIYLSTSILYYFGTVDGKESRFFSSGALLTTILIVVTTYLFGVYIENFSQYNELYGSIGALLIFLLYIWLNSNLLLLGFELNASLMSLKNNME